MQRNYITSEISFAAHLLSNGCIIEEVLREGRKVKWRFVIEADRLSQLEASWPSSGDARFWNAYQTLKGQLQLRKD
jgi:hypothetical protein